MYHPTANENAPACAVIKYNAGNIRSVLFALERLGVAAVVTDDADTLRRAKKVIFPGVGEAGSAMAYLRERGLDKLICSLTQPVLGICLGMQLMCAQSAESNTACLGIFDTQVRKFPTNAGLKVPQIGWNDIYNLQTDVFATIPEHSFVYFVHSFYVELCAHTIATANYTEPYSAALHKNNFYGMQFHPEKSGDIGEQMLRNFLNL